MNTHYIPRLLLRQFATANDKINSYDYLSKTFTTKKIKKTFSEEDLYDEELEKAFATKLEGPFADLLNHKLLSGDTIQINRTENLLMRKFLMVNFLRAPIVNEPWENMVKRTHCEKHPSILLHDFIQHCSPEMKELFDKTIPSKDTYLSDLKEVMEMDSLEAPSDSLSLAAAVRHAMAPMILFWDCSETGQEFILPKLPGISQMDYQCLSDLNYKVSVLVQRKNERKLCTNPLYKPLQEALQNELDRLIWGSAVYPDNFGLYPLSPTRCLVCASPYFRAFFPIRDDSGQHSMIPPFFEKTQFDKHFWEPMRMELFEPCVSIENKNYKYTVKHLTSKETLELNALMLHMETEEFVFRDFNSIRDSFWYYTHEATFAFKEKHDFAHFG